MWVIVLFLILGLLIGYFEVLPERYVKNIDGMMMKAMLLLLFVMGMQMGASEEIWSNLLKIGINSFLLALFAVVGSIIVLYLVSLFCIRDNKEQVGEND